MKRMLSVLLLIGLCGCGTGYNFSPYVGQQQPWQTQPGSYVKVVDKATFYAIGQFPDRPYIILGTVAADNEGALAKAVHQQGADAALIFADKTYSTGAVAVAAPGVVWGAPLTYQVINARLIRFVK